MFKRAKGFLIILLAFFIFIASSDRPMTAASNEELVEINELIKEKKNQLSKTVNREKSVLSSLLSSQKQLDKIEKDLEYLNNKIGTVQRSISSLEKELNNIQRELDSLERKHQEQRIKFDKRLVATYKYGPMSYLELLFSAENFGDLVSKFETLSYFLRSDLNLMQEVTEISGKITEKQREYETKKRNLEKQRANYVTLKKSAIKQQNQKQIAIEETRAQLRKVQNDRRNLEAALDELEETSRQIEQEIKRKQQREKGALGTGEMIWPLKGRISSSFGWRHHPILKKNKFHSGIDIAVPSSTSVKAADGGRVLISGWNGGYGYYIAIDHGNGISTAYAHNSRLLVKEGELVYQGQEIAKSGSTGLSTGPHLHFEVRDNGKPVEPLKYLPK